jgi:hypothetical protein
LRDTTLFVTGGGEDDAGELYVTSCTCEFSRKYDPEENPGGAVWHLVAADQVPDGAETAPVEGTPAPEPSPAASPVAAWHSRETWG